MDCLKMISPGILPNRLKRPVEVSGKDNRSRSWHACNRNRGLTWALVGKESLKIRTYRRWSACTRPRKDSRNCKRSFFLWIGIDLTHDYFTPNLPYWNMNGDPSVQELPKTDQLGNTCLVLSKRISKYCHTTGPPNDRADVPAIAFNGALQVIKPPG